jgi:hypothetical protein
MTDSKTKKKADRKRVALAQDWERDYLIAEIDDTLNDIRRMGMALGQMAGRLSRARHRLSEGFPAKKRARK